MVEVFAELDQETVQKRWRHLNVLLRLSMLTGLQMQLDATLNLLADMAAEITSFDKALIYFWDEEQEQAQLRIARGIGLEESDQALAAIGGNVLNYWVMKYTRPMLVPAGRHPQADKLLETVGASQVLAVPFFVSNRVMGSLQIFSSGFPVASQPLANQPFAHPPLANQSFSNQLSANKPAANKPSANKEQINREDAQLLWILSLVAENLLTREYANEGLLRFAYTDYLTGLRTRGYFEQQLDLEFKRAERRRQKFSLLMMDIDHFKQLNDTFGHHVGDQVLRDVASILMKGMREVDTVARYGGEEFVMILPETTEVAASYVAQRLRKAVEQTKFSAGSPRSMQHLTISIGVAVFDTDARSKRALIEAADAALYTAKNGGRNRVVCFSELAQKDEKEIP